MLMDSAFIQERDAEFISKKHRSKGLPPVEPLYLQKDVLETLSRMKGMAYETEFDVTGQIRCRFVDAGHILGSASVVLSIREGPRQARLAFTGDLGRPHLPILRDPVFVGDDSRYLISESTYGGRVHAPVEEMDRQLLEPIRRAYERRGKVIIPAFSLGRTQEVLHVLHRLSTGGQIDHLPVFVDSPLSVNVTEVFRKHPECFDRETRSILESSNNTDPFGFESLTYIRSVEESKALNERSGPCIIIAASGMCEAGRVVHHLSNNIRDRKNMVLIVGYQAENTLGKKLVLQEPVVNILGEPHEVRAEVVVLNSFSAHADRNELMGYIGKFDRKRMKSIFLVHGDPDQSEKLAQSITGAGFRNVSIPVRGEKAVLN
jgi:metallo-beta-lactamase family protein